MAYSGIYAGRGVWRISERDGVCRVTYSIDLTIENRWIRLVSRLLPVTGIHSRLMQQMLTGLGRYLVAGESRAR